MLNPARPILLVDDDDEDLELTLQALQKYRRLNRVEVVHDVAAALDYLYRRNSFAERADALPALIVLDLKMPGVDGVELLRSIKEDASMRTIPVVVLTASREEYDLVRSYDVGANAYVTKPTTFPEFAEAVETIGEFWLDVNVLPRATR
jgi:CheY-like chemotaxis protein